MATANPDSILTALASDPTIGGLVDTSLPAPSPFRGSGPIRLIILGQDPTVKNEQSRKRVATVLNLDRPGSLRNYISQICNALGLTLEANIYATNYVNAFFTVPPASLKEPDILGVAARHCLHHLIDELRQFPSAPVLALGEPLLRHIALGTAPQRVREYWGFSPNWRSGDTRPFALLPVQHNSLQRTVFPFPHQPSVNKAFYSKRLSQYLAFMKLQCFNEAA